MRTTTSLSERITDRLKLRATPEGKRHEKWVFGIEPSRVKKRTPTSRRATTKASFCVSR